MEMMKPDWKDAPEWANYLAMDQDGFWTWFESEPRPISDEWFPSIGKSKAASISSWHETLEQRQQNDAT